MSWVSWSKLVDLVAKSFWPFMIQDLVCAIPRSDQEWRHQLFWMGLYSSWTSNFITYRCCCIQPSCWIDIWVWWRSVFLLAFGFQITLLDIATINKIHDANMYHMHIRQYNFAKKMKALKTQRSICTRCTQITNWQTTIWLKVFEYDSDSLLLCILDHLKASWNWVHRWYF